SPWAVLCLAFLLTVASVYLATTRLPLHTDQDDLVSEKLDYHRRYKEFLREFGDQEYLYLVVEAGNDIARAKHFVRHFVGEVGRRGGAAHFREILYRIDNPAMEQSYLLYLPRDQLTRLEGFFRQPGTEPARLARWNDFADLVAGINELLKRPVDPTQRESLTIGFTLLDGIVDGMAGALKGPVIPTPQLQGALIGGGRAIDPDGFFLSENGRYLFALLMPIKNYATLGVIAKPLSLLRDALTATRAALPDVAAGLTGRPVLQADEMVVTNRDMTRGTLLALAAVALLFIGYFRRPTRPVLAVVALVMGMSWTYGFAALSIGYLNILSIVFAVILVGAGIEYGLQLVARYREELAADGDVHRAITSCITQTGRGNLTACLTTAAAFFAALGTQFLALRELGAIAGIGILL
ncbi:MAG: MMPL family transporter, partial [Deltaproteobacteria bacterium]|nr:MMPL family transporter [Deltaproteobacteria bacterium]